MVWNRKGEEIRQKWFSTDRKPKATIQHFTRLLDLWGQRGARVGRLTAKLRN